MPKVSADYVNQKRNRILDAALSVCLKKPMHEVSMRDIISESGISQGNVYRYFTNIDDVLIGLINRENVQYDTKALVDAAIRSNNTPEKVIYEIFSVWEKTVLDNNIVFQSKVGLWLGMVIHCALNLVGCVGMLMAVI